MTTEDHFETTMLEASPEAPVNVRLLQQGFEAFEEATLGRAVVDLKAEFLGIGLSERQRHGLAVTPGSRESRLAKAP